MKTKTIPSAVSNSTPAACSGFTLGLDLGDRSHHVCVLDAAGQIVREASLPNTRPALAQLLAEFPHATVALEAGTHSLMNRTGSLRMASGRAGRAFTQP